MNMINFVFLAILWLGVFLILSKPGYSLKERAGQYLSKSSARRGAENFFRRFTNARKAEIMQKELSESLAYVRNLVIVGRGEKMSSQLLLEELADITKELSPVYLNMAHSLHMYNEERAAGMLYEALPLNYARDIGELLSGWERVPPGDMISTVDVYVSALREDMQTRQRRKDETISDLVYFPVVVNCMAVLMNFIYVAYFLQQKEALEILF